MAVQEARTLPETHISETLTAGMRCVRGQSVLLVRVCGPGAVADHEWSLHASAGVPLTGVLAHGEAILVPDASAGAYRPLSDAEVRVLPACPSCAASPSLSPIVVDSARLVPNV